MNSLRYHILLWTVLFFPMIAHAQHEYDVWHFGYNAGIDFRSGSPVLLENTPVYANEGTAVMCDRYSGQLLFSADGDNVYNRNGAIMPNGSDILGGDGTSRQGVLIVPMLCSPAKYYLFTADFEGYTQPTNRGVHYSVIDMNLNGGLGDVTQKNIPLLPKASERQTVVMHENGHDYWIIFHSLGGRTFYAFKITAAGIDPTPVISVAGMDQGNPPEYPNTTIGCLEASPTGRKLALTGFLDGWPPHTPIGSLIEIYDFDPATGQISNPVPLLGGGIPIPDGLMGFKAYGVSFSPDGSRLYVGGAPLLQWSLDVDDPAAIRASQTVVSDIDGAHGLRWTHRSMELGPDGRIYINQANSYVSVIPNPNARGTACGFIDRAYQFTSLLATEFISLPNNINDRAFFNRPTNIVRQARIESVIQPDRCSGATVTASAGFIGYEWSDGQIGRTVSFNRSGRYVLTTTDSNGCTSMAEVTIAVPDVPPLIITASGPLSFCDGGNVTLTAPEGYAAYRWSTGASANFITVERSGTYIVTATTREGCVRRDTAIVQENKPGIVHFRVAANISATPGDTVTVPIMMEMPLDGAIVQSLTLSLRYDPDMMLPLLPRLSGAAARAERELSTQGTVLSGWDLQVLKDSQGEVTLRLTAPGGVNSIQGIGELLRLRFTTFVRVEAMGQSTLAAELPLSIDIGEDHCFKIGSSSGHIDLSFCASGFRQMVVGLENYTFEGVVPNPFAKATEFRFWLGLDGDTKLEIFNGSGVLVATVLDRHLPAGYHVVRWDASAIPSGQYQYRLTSGPWTQSGQVVVLQ